MKIFHTKDRSIFTEVDLPDKPYLAPVQKKYITIHPLDYDLKTLANKLSVLASVEGYEFSSVDEDAGGTITLSRPETKQEKEDRLEKGRRDIELRDTMIAEAHENNNIRYAEKIKDPDYHAYSILQERLRERGYTL